MGWLHFDPEEFEHFSSGLPKVPPAPVPRGAGGRSEVRGHRLGRGPLKQTPLAEAEALSREGSSRCCCVKSVCFFLFRCFKGN